MKKIFLLFITLSSLTFAQKGIPKRGYAIDWMQPKALNNPLIMTYEKMEVGLNLPDSIQALINEFIKGNKGINPFNPEEIDVKATFELEKDGKWSPANFVYGFFYEDFKRNTASQSCDDWNWSKLKTRNPFRIRFAPTAPGNWRFTVQVNMNGKEVVNLGPYTFTSQESNHPGYLKISANKRYLQLGENTFMPIGQNLPKPTCYIKKDAQGTILDDPYGCATCTCAGVEEWCPHLQKLPMNPKSYMVYHQVLEKFKKAGGNYYRMLIFPHTYEIEYDQLGNYYSRMNVAWELDQVIEKTEQLDLKLHLNLFLGYPVTKAQYGVDVWDWYSDKPTDNGYCYRKELNLTDPVEFLTDPRAKSFFKKRLRYIIARWGYSPSIALMELVSEINNKWPGEYEKVYLWQKEMAEFIKNELGHDEHLLTVSYVNGTAKADKTYGVDEIDLITFNRHRETISREEIADYVDAYAKYGKPIIFSEIGTGDSNIDKCDNNTEWIKDLWLALFSGSASTGINWNNDHAYELWEHFKHLNMYTQDVNFNEFMKHGVMQSKNKLIELLYLADDKKEKSIGFIHNLTWNYFTNATTDFCKTTKTPDAIYQKFTEGNSAKKEMQLSIKKLKKNTTYIIEWYNPLTGVKMDVSEIESTKKGEIMLSYPTLTKEMPMLAYKIYPKGQKFSTVKAVKPIVVGKKIEKDPLPVE